MARRRWRGLLLSVVIAVALALLARDALTPSRLPNGVWALGHELSRLETREAERLLEQSARTYAHRPVAVEVDTKSVTLRPIDAGMTIDVAATVARAQDLSRRVSPLRRVSAWAARLWRPVQVLPLVRVDGARLGPTLDHVERSALTIPDRGGLRLQGERFVVVPARPGRRLDRDAATRALVRALEAGSPRVRFATTDVGPLTSADALDRLAARANAMSRKRVVLIDPHSPRSVTFEASELRELLSVAPEVDAVGEPQLTVDASVLERVLAPKRSTIESPAIPARFVIDAKDRVSVVPSEPDVRVDMRVLGDALLAAAVAPSHRGVLPLARSGEPELTTKAAEALGIRGLVSTFTTRHPCCEKRVENIHRIADLLDGLIVKPGETVSVNGVVGPRTAKNGFVPAPSIEEGQMVDTIGGGISQFATTLFNALFYGGIDIIERQPHTYWFSRYPMGHEATLSHPKPDLIFRNDTQAGMLLDTAYTRTSITVRIFGDNGGRSVRAEVSARQNLVEPPVEIVANPDVAPDEEKVRDAGMVGWSVMVGRVITFADGTQKEERRKVTYRPKPRKVEVHPCRVPEGEKGHTGEPCPEPEDAAEIAVAPLEP